MLKLTVVKLSGQVFRDKLPPLLLSELRGAQVWICRRNINVGIALLTSASPHLNGQVLLIFPDKDSVRLRSSDGEAYQMTFENAVEIAEQGQCLGLVLMMGGAWIEMSLLAAHSK